MKCLVRGKGDRKKPNLQSCSVLISTFTQAEKASNFLLIAIKYILDLQIVW